MNRLILLLITSLVSSASIAGTFTFTPEFNTSTHVTGTHCDPLAPVATAVTIDNMINLIDNDESPVNLPVSATGCYAVQDPNNDFKSTYDPNIGSLYDGMFNGESSEGNTNYHISPNLFLDHANDQWVDANTPGWISLASVNGAEADDGLQPFEVSYSEVGDFDLDDLLDITFDSDGWSLGFNPVNADIVGDITEILGRPTLFDHLSFVFKSANHQDWYIYDFNFWELIDGGLDIDLNDPHNMSGSWNSELLFGQHAVSHIEIVAHDPPPTGTTTTNIPEPKSLAILGLGLILLALRQKMRG